MAPLMNRMNEKSEIASRQDMTQEYQNCDHLETWLLSNQGMVAEKQIDVAGTLLSRDYKGFGNQSMNGVIEWKE